jgi:hypothetical protein
MMFCFRHLGTETGLSCSLCERPICAVCLVQTLVGHSRVMCRKSLVLHLDLMTV